MKKIFCALFLGILCSCSQHQKEVESMKEEVFAIHDEVMPLMGKMMSERQAILNEANKLFLEDSVANKAEVAEMKATAKELDDAYENMFVWMRQFKKDFEGMTQEQVIDYLEDQKMKVSKVNEDMKEALSAAKQYTKDN